MQTTDAGLLVPDHVIERKHATMTAQTFRRIRQFHTAMREEGIGVVLGCASCKTPIDLATKDHLDPTKAGGRVIVRCKCTEREVR